MNYEIILIIALSYLLGIFTMWIKERCSIQEELPLCHFHPLNQETSIEKKEEKEK